MRISKTNGLRGSIILPGDKSISHRSAIFLALSEGEAKVSNFGTSADCAATVKCLQALGVQIERSGSELIIRGVGKTGLRQAVGDLDCENSGTTMRLMAGVLAGQTFASVMTGDDSLRKRPMKRVISPLERMGAEIESDDGRAPLHVKGRSPLKAIDYEPEAASAQLKSCVLLAGLNAEGTTTVVEKTPTRDHTERMLKWLGVEISEEALPGGGVRLSVSGDAKLSARDISVPADLSSAAFFIVAAAFLKNSELSMPNVGFNPSRKAVVDVLSGLGIDITASNQRDVCNEPVADLLVKGNDSVGTGELTVLSGSVIANLIDEIPILAVAGTQMNGGLEVRNAAELRIKESDRIAAIVENLRRMGAEVEEFDDGFRVERSQLKGAVIDSFGDHRIAMAFAVAGLFAEGETEIVGAESAAVSFPAFFEELQRVIY